MCIKKLSSLNIASYIHFMMLNSFLPADIILIGKFQFRFITSSTLTEFCLGTIIILCTNFSANLETYNFLSFSSITSTSIIQYVPDLK